MTNTAEYYNPVTWLRKLQYFANSKLSIKFGHPFPPVGRIKDLMGKYPIRILKEEVTPGQSDILFFQTMVSPV
ncbi:MAG: hypothetical protein PHS88_02035 [Candidatus Omnitrophica bacterium]|nr:hypothetical protein [Candidatus Omnitrophota bacterium]